MSILLSSGLLAAGAASVGHAVQVVVAGRRASRNGRTYGAFAERRVGQVLSRTGLPHIGDVTFVGDAGAVHVDHLVLAGSRLVALETRNFAGRISGSGHGSWTQWDRARRTLTNPLAGNTANQNAIASEFACSCDSLIVLIGSARFQGDVPDGVVALGDLPQALARLADPETHGARAAFERIKALTADGTARRRLAHRHQRRAGERHHRGAGASAWALAGCACAVLGIFAL